MFNSIFSILYKDYQRLAIVFCILLYGFRTY